MISCVRVLWGYKKRVLFVVGRYRSLGFVYMIDVFVGYAYATLPFFIFIRGRETLPFFFSLAVRRAGSSWTADGRIAMADRAIFLLFFAHLERPVEEEANVSQRVM